MRELIRRFVSAPRPVKMYLIGCVLFLVSIPLVLVHTRILYGAIATGTIGVILIVYSSFKVGFWEKLTPKPVNPGNYEHLSFSISKKHYAR